MSRVSVDLPADAGAGDVAVFDCRPTAFKRRYTVSVVIVGIKNGTAVGIVSERGRDRIEDATEIGVTGTASLVGTRNEGIRFISRTEDGFAGGSLWPFNT
ncbi:hypothetical protein EVAR_67137_1 [Eumeta japonica]|uniref:Uncharacterized protein n=1 Tax=Eumeta variegata TaxID=151549 RepID=A0A4C1ZU65_EUMVA|nr:hypothetical protein EVAR_67137_1 [Eumeta japonica]